MNAETLKRRFADIGARLSVETGASAGAPGRGRAAAQRRRHVRRKNWHDRKNEGFIRQGEWFFLPRPDFEPPSASLVLHNEPIRRPGGTPHVVEQLYRHGGTVVYVHPKYPGGLSEG